MSDTAKQGCFGKLVSYIIYGGLIGFAVYFTYFYITQRAIIVEELQKKEQPFKEIISQAQKIMADSNSKSIKTSPKPTLRGKILILQDHPDSDGLSFDGLTGDVNSAIIASVPADVHSVVMTRWHTEIYTKNTRGNTYVSKCSYALIDLDQKKVLYRGSFTGDHPNPPDSFTGPAPRKEMIQMINSLEITQ